MKNSSFKESKIINIIMAALLTVGIMFIPDVNLKAAVTVDKTVHVGEGVSLEVNDGTVMAANGEIISCEDVVAVEIEEEGSLTIGSSVTFGNSSTTISCSGGDLYNNGILNVASFDSTIFRSATNYGTIKAASVNITRTTMQNSPSAVYSVTSSFKASEYSSEYIGNVYAEPTTQITLEGGGFNLYVGNRDTSVSGDMVGEAWEFFDPVPLSNFSKADGSNYLKLSGVTNGIYAKDSVTLTPASGYSAKLSTSEETSYSTSLTFDEDHFRQIVFDDGSYDADAQFYIRNNSDYTWAICDIEEANSMLTKVVFDGDHPEVSPHAEADGKEISISESDTVSAKKLVITAEVFDKNLYNDSIPLEDNIEVGGGTYEIKKSNNGQNAVVVMTFETEKSDNGDKRSCYYIIKDLAGNIASLGFSLKYAKVTPTASLSCSDINVGETPKPVLTTNSDGKDKAEFYYKESSAADSAFSKTVPDKPGSYVVMAVVPETSVYDEISCTATFSISKIKPTAKVSVPNTYVGDEYSPTITTNSDGKATYVYKATSAPNDAYKADKPIKAGNYMVKATIAETDKYQKIVCEGSFKISKRETKASVKVSDTSVGGKISPVLTTDSDGKDKAVFEYKASGDEDKNYSKTKPTKAGKYKVRATIPATDKYEAAVCEDTFKIEKTPTTASVKLDDQYVGVKLKPVVTTNSDGKDKVYFLYKAQNAPDSAYSGTVPRGPGKFTVKAVVPATENCEAVTAEDDFEISYYEDDTLKYEISGKKGENEFYVSDVFILPPKGFYISSSQDGPFSTSIPYSESVKTVYYSRVSDGATTKGFEVNESIKIDKDKPAIVKVVSHRDRDDSEREVKLVDGAVIYTDKLTISFSDENLSLVSVDGDDQSDNGNSSEIVLSAGSGEKDFTITAKDLAGNEFTMTLHVKAAWRETNTVPEDIIVTLSSGVEYNVEDGSWTIEGDSTVYSGNIKFYINSDGDYVFTRN